MQTVKYPYKKKKIELRIPKGFTSIHLAAGGEWDLYEYVYSDSSIIYFTNDENGGLNYSNITNQKNGYSKLFNINMTHDSLTFQGLDSDKLYWKYIFLGKSGIGYLKVSDKRKSEFDQILNNVKIR
jgi:hypothetical protein